MEFIDANTENKIHLPPGRMQITAQTKNITLFIPGQEKKIKKIYFHIMVSFSCWGNENSDKKRIQVDNVLTILPCSC